MQKVFLKSNDFVSNESNHLNNNNERVESGKEK